MARKRNPYPPAKTSRRRVTPDGAPIDPNLAHIDLTARAGQDGLTVGDSVRINGTGLYSGDPAVVVALVSGVIPAAIVRVASGNTRRVRTIDLIPIVDRPSD